MNYDPIGPRWSQLEMRRFTFLAQATVEVNTPRHLANVRAELREELSHQMAADLQQETARLVLKLIAAVYGQELEEVAVSYPADWWEAFKERWLSRWLPVRRKTVTLSAKALYPLVKAPPDMDAVMYMARVEWDSSAMRGKDEQQ